MAELPAPSVIRATPKGRHAQELWRPLFHAIEKRWRARFGEDRIDQLQESLATLISRIDTELARLSSDLALWALQHKPG